MNEQDRHWALARELADEFASLDSVDAVAVGGSLTLFGRDEASDIDLYVFSKEPPALSFREQMVSKFGASKQNLGLRYWDEGDEWFHQDSGIEVDCIYWSPEWIERQLEQVIEHHQPNMSYTTCFWSTIQRSEIMFDRSGWYGQLKDRTQVEYPEPLRENILKQNLPLLRDIIPSYLNQTAKALKRGDAFSVHHRLNEFLATYFDVLFAVNRILHPGEKRLVEFAMKTCRLKPMNFDARIQKLFPMAGQLDAKLPQELHELMDDLEALL